MKKFMIGVFVCDLIFLSLITVFADPYATTGDVELHVTLLRILIEVSALAVIAEVRRG